MAVLNLMKVFTIFSSTDFPWQLSFSDHSISIQTAIGQSNMAIHESVDHILVDIWSMMKGTSDFFSLLFEKENKKKI